MIKAGVPVVPGGEGLLKAQPRLKCAGTGDWLPVILKLTAGGGGKGMRIVWEEEGELEKA